MISQAIEARQATATQCMSTESTFRERTRPA
jgi:hypothetical protein